MTQRRMMAAQISDPTISWGVDDNFLSNEYRTVLQLLSSNSGPDGRCFHAAWAVSKSAH